MNPFSAWKEHITHLLKSIDVKGFLDHWCNSFTISDYFSWWNAEWKGSTNERTNSSCSALASVLQSHFSRIKQSTHQSFSQSINQLINQSSASHLEDGISLWEGLRAASGVDLRWRLGRQRGRHWRRQMSVLRQRTHAITTQNWEQDKRHKHFLF